MESSETLRFPLDTGLFRADIEGMFRLLATPDAMRDRIRFEVTQGIQEVAQQTRSNPFGSDFNGYPAESGQSA